jgi:hypothetical protein
MTFDGGPARRTRAVNAPIPTRSQFPSPKAHVIR